MTSPTSERERLARIFAKLAEDHIELSDPETAQAWQEDCATASASIEDLVADARRSLLDKVKAEVITAQDKKEYWPVWRKELFDRQRTALAQLRKEIG